ncbi:MAG: hypothetical protein M1814_000134 [Vezdaea aestivalis]|nr:MAG: hypothetical protein M1814_000134 [Vezdaea aestivalis]
MSGAADQSAMAGVDDQHRDGPVDKAKATEAPDVSMDEEESSDEEEPGTEDAAGQEMEEDDEGEEAIDLGNIVGSRTRGKNIDFVKAAQEAGDDLDPDEDEDDDFVEPVETDNEGHPDAMQE